MLPEGMVYDSAVIGAGPAGIALVSTLLEHGKEHRIFWIDDSFGGGRLACYRSVPSNTRVKLFREYFAHVLRSSAVSEGSILSKFGDDEHCGLGLIVDLLKDATECLLQTVDHKKERVDQICFNGDHWAVHSGAFAFKAKRVFLATGAHPKSIKAPTSVAGISLEDALDPAKLAAILLASKNNARVAVVGNSHSAILVLRNLKSLGIPSYASFSRHPLRFAEYTNEGIKYDNTGLKGIAADWARAHRWPTVHIDGLDEVEEKLVGFTHVIYAVGFERNSLPKAFLRGSPVCITGYDSRGQLLSHDGLIPSLFGCGIAFPERVVDLSGEREEAVGLYKFLCFCSKRPFDDLHHNTKAVVH